MIGVAMEDTMISKMTDVKYTGCMSPTASPFCETIRATSPRVIMPTPIFKESSHEKRQTLEIRPQPTIFVMSATKMNATENSRMDAFTSSISVF